MYEYNAFVKRVVDGDTYDVTVDLGFKLRTDIRVRLNGADTPESWRPRNQAEADHADKANKRVIELIENKIIKIRSYYLGIYGRYTVDVILPDNKLLADLLKEENLIKLDCYE